MEDKRRLTDEEAVLIIQRNEPGAEALLNALFDKYDPLMRKLAYEAYICNYHAFLTIDDLLSVCMSSLFLAISKYKRCILSFKNFFLKTARRDITKVIMKNYQYYSNIAYSLEDKCSCVKGEEISYHDIVKSEDIDVTEIIDNKEMIKIISDFQDSTLDDEERKVLIRRVFCEESIKSIADELGVDRRHVSYVLNKSKNKLLTAKKH